MHAQLSNVRQCQWCESDRRTERAGWCDGKERAAQHSSHEEPDAGAAQSCSWTAHYEVRVMAEQR